MKRITVVEIEGKDLLVYRLTARIRAWWGERRARRDAEDEADDAFWASITEDGEDEWLRPPWESAPVKMPGQRYHGKHARPGDIPDQPAGGAG